MTIFYVRYAIEVDAETYEEAADLARESMTENEELVILEVAVMPASGDFPHHGPFTNFEVE